MIQTVLRYLGLDEQSKRFRKQAVHDLEVAEVQLGLLRQRFEETSRISTTGSRDLKKTLSESDFSELQRRAAGG